MSIPGENTSMYVTYWDPTINEFVHVSIQDGNVVTDPANRGQMTISKAAALVPKEFG